MVAPPGICRLIYHVVVIPFSMTQQKMQMLQNDVWWEVRILITGYKEKNILFGFGKREMLEMVKKMF